MKNALVENIGKSLLRIISALAVIIGSAAAVYLLWQPGGDAPLPPYTDNAIWIGHGWLGDDGWFARCRRNKADFRGEEKVAALFRKLKENRISTVYPHLCPARIDGRIAPCHDGQVELFLDVAEKYDVAVIPWVGGVFEDSARPEDERWRRNFVASVDELLKKHPRLAGVQINIEPMPDGNADFLRLLDELRPVTRGKILSVAAYPPPTNWHRFPDVHWSLPYIHRIARHCDQLAVMMYDTAIPLEKFYIRLMTEWTHQLVGVVRTTECELLLGIPAYEDAGVGYHRPQVENIDAALRGIAASDRKNEIGGIAVYCEWEMDERKWQSWQKFIR